MPASDAAHHAQHGHHHHHRPHRPGRLTQAQPERPAFSLLTLSLGARLAVAVTLILAVWAAIFGAIR